MKFQAPSWWKVVSDAARRRDRLSAMALHPTPFDPVAYAQAEAAYWRTVEAVHA